MKSLLVHAATMLALVLPARAVQGTATGNPAAFESGLQAARESMHGNSWRKAQRAWGALLTEHAGQEYARPWVEEIRQGLKRSGFWARTSEPRLDEFISGKLQKHSRGSGKLQLLYTPGTLADFEPVDQDGMTVYTHPLHFSGPWRLKVKGSHDVVCDVAWMFTQGDSGIGLRVGQSRRDAFFFTYHQAWAWGPEGKRELAKVEPRESRASADTLEFEVIVGARELELRIGGREELSVPRDGSDFGGLTWLAKQAPERITLSGEADRGWLDGVRDAAVADQWREFEAAWVDPLEFEAWGALDELPRDELGLEELLSGARFEMALTPNQNRILEQLEPYLSQGRAGSLLVLEQLAKLPDGALPARAAAYLEFLSAFDLGRYQQALACGGPLRVEQGEELELGLLYSIVLERADRLDESQALLERLLASQPGQASAYGRLVEVLLLRGEPARAREVLLRGREALPASASLARRELQVVKAELGPPWKRVHEFEGEHFLVRSEVSPKLSRQAAEVLDATMRRCEEVFGALPEHTPRSLAHVFAGEQGYRDYVEGIADQSQENTLGIYSPLLAQVAVWNQPDEAGLWDVLRHESVHRYVHLRVGSVPRWLNEGLAETISAECLADGTWKAGELRKVWVDHLRRVGGDVTSLQVFAYREDEFLKDTERNYALSWGWLHFLRYEDEEGREVFAHLWQGLVDGGDCAAVLDEALDGRDTAALHLRYIAFLNRLAAG